MLAGVAVRSSSDLNDPAWDKFLQQSPLGHFQQASLWAQTKTESGWRPLRLVFLRDGEITQGFQILVKSTRFGPVGLVFKGPVCETEEAANLDFVVGQLIGAARRAGLRALIAQPPDRSHALGPALARHGFLEANWIGVVSSSQLVDLSGGMEKLRSGMRKTTLSEASQAQRRGVRIREGGLQDIGAFFNLMSATCRRQGVSPNPATEPAMRALHRVFGECGRARLSLAECEGKPVAGAFSICFGDRVTIWKKGWSGEFRERHPSTLVTYELIEWAANHGYRVFDFAACRRELVLALQRGEVPGESLKKSVSFFNIGFGGTPMLLPEPLVYITNPMGRFLFRHAAASPLVQRLAARVMK
jgi:lipid II:glycine glycyltransferase (peptidoglycan interpeptide bridge formation enzyme)